MNVVVTAGGDAVRDATILLNAAEHATTDSDGQAVLYSMDDGNHTLEARKQGYESASSSFTVDPLPYLFSDAVKTQRTPEERMQRISEGKVVFVFYDTPNCPNCLRMKPWAGAIANVNRECAAYELLNLINEGPREEVKEMFPDQTSVVTPVLVIEGPAGRYVSKGLLPKIEMERRIQSVSDGRCPTQ